MTDEHPDLPAHDVQRRPSFWHWIVEGLRASVLLAPRIAASPSPWQLMLIVLIPLLLVLGIERLQIDGPAFTRPRSSMPGGPSPSRCGSAGRRCRPPRA